MKNIYQIKIQVKNVKPSIYRTILIDPNINFVRLHEYIQSCFGLMDYHLWEFSGKFKNAFAVMPEFRIAPNSDDEWDAPEYYAHKVKIKDILKQEKQKLQYWYDFGDDWKFDTTLQKIIPKSELNSKIKKIPYLLRVKGPMLMEDSGGIHYWSEIIGLYEYLKAGKVLSDVNKDYIEDLRWKAIGDMGNDNDWQESYVSLVGDLYETDWGDFDIEENIFSLKDSE